MDNPQTESSVDDTTTPQDPKMIQNEQSDSKLKRHRGDSLVVFSNKEGMSVVVTTFFIVGEMAGAGIVTIPKALSNATWQGIGLLLICAVISAFTGSQLGQCWTMLQERWPVYQTQCRKPYPEIGSRAFGTPVKHLVSICIDLTLFGALVVFIILTSGNIVDILSTLFDSHCSPCVMQIFVVIFLLPFTFFGSPKDYWGVTLAAMVCTCLACLFMLISMAIDRQHIPNPKYSEFSAVPFFLSFSTIAFAYGGHSAFPTIQHDMKEPSRFSTAVIFAYIVIIVLYFPIGAVGYGVYGDSVAGNIIASLQTVWCRVIANMLITVHVLFTCVIVVNPVNLEIESALNIPRGFGVEQCASRTLVLVFAWIIAECFPNFGALLNLIGGSTITLLTFVFPGLFYLRLKKIVRSERSPNFKLNNWELLLNGFIIVFGVVGGVFATYSSVSSIVKVFTSPTGLKPCFLQ